MPFSRLINELLSSEDDINKDTSAMIEVMVVTAAKVLLADIRDEKGLGWSICKVMRVESVGIINWMLTM